MPRFDPHPERRPVVVAGASSGIGAATAAALAAAGHPVALGARRVDKCEELAATIRAGGGEAFAHALDVGDADSVKAFAAAAEDALGPVEVVVSGAGDLSAGRLHELGSAEFVAQVQVHLVGAHRLVSHFVPQMVARRRGDIVFISSDTVPAPRSWTGAYVAAKSGVEGMARTMQMELEGTGVRASIVRPGPTATGMGMTWDAETTGAVLEDWVKWGHARHPYFLRPSDVAAAVAAVVATPRGAHLRLVEVQPEAPLEES
ncbi:SDR family oxidoreductase [Actinomadura livida]|uniref:NADP-dependent 3-hydroxy acid dehydrogenase YdfG n=1 Tax=Actinomadura livida TaxID=79909 RepID=A0A7W7N0G9_9ACTN|nr:MULTISPECIES: SDR family oxidoreductase [Actinomadura]MBB4776915.1 NADP-dependent 3-hydroxy acid dehydrogenase YdfG [Actinomadura catellatispora]GGT95708.1 putative oxidoreductase [Actinomadura livida]